MKKSIQIGRSNDIKSFISRYPSTIRLTTIIPSIYFISNTLDERYVFSVLIILGWEILKVISIYLTARNTLIDNNTLHFYLSVIANTALMIGSVITATGGLLSFIGVANIESLIITFFVMFIIECVAFLLAMIYSKSFIKHTV